MSETSKPKKSATHNNLSIKNSGVNNLKISSLIPSAIADKNLSPIDGSSKRPILAWASSQPFSTANTILAICNARATLDNAFSVASFPTLVAAPSTISWVDSSITSPDIAPILTPVNLDTSPQAFSIMNFTPFLSAPINPLFPIADLAFLNIL